MAKSTQRIPPELQKWIDARKRFHLSHAQVQMTRELGMNPRNSVTSPTIAGTVESSSADFHRADLPEALRESQAGSRAFH
jgi:hypothetical protein